MKEFAVLWKRSRYTC